MAAWEENRAGVPELGVYHPRYACAFCGATLGEFQVVVIRSTMARGMLCTNTIACEQRRFKKKQLELFA